jgi:hypothetical protein
MNWKTCSKVIPLAVLVVCILASHCHGAPTEDELTIWKTEVPSPDGLWIANARTIQNGGFGSAHIDTVVYLKQSRVSQPPAAVLAFSCEGPAARPYVLDNANAGGTIDLTMKWVSPSRLQVTYDRHPDLYLQTVKYGGITISVQDLSNQPTNGKDSK